MIIKFSKMHGLGNDFVVIDAINQSINLDPEQIRLLSDRHFGVGFDQLLLVEPAVSIDADFKYRIFNADGSEVAQCGNGARCFAKFVRDNHLTDKDTVIVDTNAGQLKLLYNEQGLITVNMGIPKHKPEEIPLYLASENKFYQLEVAGYGVVDFAALSIGNPHAVIRVDDIALAPVTTLGALLESHSVFPERVNVGFMEIVNRHAIKLRVYERGAGETLACGSGACAAVIAGIDQALLDNKVIVSLPGGDLTIEWLGHDQPVWMTGSATLVFQGQIVL